MSQMQSQHQVLPQESKKIIRRKLPKPQDGTTKTGGDTQGTETSYTETAPENDEANISTEMKPDDNILPSENDIKLGHAVDGLSKAAQTKQRNMQRTLKKQQEIARMGEEVEEALQRIRESNEKDYELTIGGENLETMEENVKIKDDDGCRGYIAVYLEAERNSAALKAKIKNATDEIRELEKKKRAISDIILDFFKTTGKSQFVFRSTLVTIDKKEKKKAITADSVVSSLKEEVYNGPPSNYTDFIESVAKKMDGKETYEKIVIKSLEPKRQKK